jgi:hypothetical protein
VDIRAEFVRCALSSYSGGERENIVSEIALYMARLKIRDAMRKDVQVDPLNLEIDYERRNLAETAGKASGVIYEGFKRLCSSGTFLLPGGLSIL